MVVLVGNADYAIVEAEADKVAKQAADHLRRAKKRLRSRNDDSSSDTPPQRYCMSLSIRPLPHYDNY